MAQFFKVVFGGRKVAIPVTDFEAFCWSVCSKFALNRENLIINTSDDTEVEEDFFNYLCTTTCTSNELLYVRDRSCQVDVIGTGTCSWISSSPTLSTTSKSECSVNVIQSSDVMYVETEPCAAQSYISQPSTSQLCTSQASTSLHTGNHSLPKKNCDSNTNFVSPDIPWHKLPEDIRQNLLDEEILDKKDKKSLVNVFWSEISRKILRDYASRIVLKYPESFKRAIDGMVISNGVEELLLQFESKRDNANRRNYKDDSNPSTKETPVNSVHVGLTVNMDDRKELIKLFNQPNRTESEDQLVADLMKANYGYIQADIRKETSMNELKHLWPFLYHEKFFMQYFNELTEFDLSTAISTVAETQFTRLHKYMLNNKHLVDLVEGSDMSVLYKILSKEFNEDQNVLLTLKDLPDQIEKEKVPCTPHIVVVGHSVADPVKCLVFVDKEVIMEVMTVKAAMAVQFAAFYVFGIHFPKKAINTLDMVQRFILKMRDPSGKKKRKINEKVLTLAENIYKFEAKCEIDI